MELVTRVQIPDEGVSFHANAIEHVSIYSPRAEWVLKPNNLGEGKLNSN